MVYLTGETALVRELGEACVASGFRVAFQTNSGEEAIPSRAGFRKSAAIPRGVSFAAELTNTDPVLKKRNLIALDRKLDRSATLLTSSVTVAAGEQAGWIRHPERMVGIGALPTLLSNRLVELAPGLQTARAAISRAGEFFAELGKEVAVVQDRAGMVMPRILCMLVNEAAFALMEEIASPADMDLAMKLGTSYPRGPVEWAGKIGIGQVVSVLRALHSDLGEERYRIAPLLQMMSAARLKPT
ncbi:MAG TPA: 3-hydroxyacyl-CoA dehydrogenase family protein [Bacteroidota bacterium]